MEKVSINYSAQHVLPICQFFLYPKRYILIFLTAIFYMVQLSAQEPYVPFPKDSLNWHIVGRSANIPSLECAIVFINGKDTIINDKNYTQVFGYGWGFIGIREENKKIFAFIDRISDKFGEVLLYDFNLEPGRFISYNFGMYIKWDHSPKLYFDDYLGPTQNMVMIQEKGITTLADGSVRNTVTVISIQQYTPPIQLQWIEGLGSITLTGLLDPLISGYFLDGTYYNLHSISNCFGEPECTLYLKESGEIPFCTWSSTCVAVNDLISDTINDQSILLKWSKPETYLPVVGYSIFRNNILLVDTLTKTTSYLDENLQYGKYDYYVVSRYLNNCVSDSSNHVKVKIGVEVKETKVPDRIMLLPNPTTGELRVTSYGLQITNVEVFDIYGRKLLEQNAENGMQQANFQADGVAFNISHLPNGLYFVKILTGQGVVMRKVVKY